MVLAGHRPSPAVVVPPLVASFCHGSHDEMVTTRLNEYFRGRGGRRDAFNKNNFGRFEDYLDALVVLGPFGSILFLWDVCSWCWNILGSF